MAFFSRSTRMPEYVTVPLKAFHVSSDTSYEITDVYKGKSMGVFKHTDSITVYVNPNGAVLLKATPQKKDWKNGGLKLNRIV